MKLIKAFRKTLLSVFCAFGCASCNLPDSTQTSVSFSDPFENPNITEELLEDNLCMVFEDLRFIKTDKQDHVYVVNAGKIAKHKCYSKKAVNLDAFRDLVGKPLLEALDTIGTPSFRGRYDMDPTLTYVVSHDSYVNIGVEKDENGNWSISTCDVYDEAGFSEYFGKSYDYSQDGTIQRDCYIPSFNRVRSIPMGASFDFVLFVLGMPDQGTYHGLSSAGKCGGSWRLDNKRELVVNARWLESDYPMFDSKYCENGQNTYCGVCRVYFC